jgi:predicted transcriptional regulator
MILNPDITGGELGRLPPVPTLASKDAIQNFAESVVERLGFLQGDSLHLLHSRLGGRLVCQNRPAVNGTPLTSLEVRSLRDFTVFLPTTTTPQRDSVTLAHELGHLLLHFPMLQKRFPGTVMVAKTWVPDSDAGDERRADLEANWFAYAFLMPQRAFRDQWVLLEGDLHKMSSAWRLGEQAIALRAHSLSLTEGLPSLPAIVPDPHTSAAKACAHAP